MEAPRRVGVSAFVGLVARVVLTVTTRAVTGRSLERASGDLGAARTALARLVANRAAFASHKTPADHGAPGISSAHQRCRFAANDRNHRRHRERLPPSNSRRGSTVTDGAHSSLGSPRLRPQGKTRGPHQYEQNQPVVAGHSNQAIVAVRGGLFLMNSSPLDLPRENAGNTAAIRYTLDEKIRRSFRSSHIPRSTLTTAGSTCSGSSLPQAARGELHD